jgi:FkbM family methyltransferase
MREEIATLKELCNKNKNVVDVGANKGDLALFFIKFARHVYCFEPIPSICESLARRFRECNISIHCCALGAIEGEGKLIIPCVRGEELRTRASMVKQFAEEIISGNRVEGTREVSVEVKKMDSLDLQNIGLIKIDVEGYELEVLEGARETIIREMPNLYVELEQMHNSSRRFWETVNTIVKMGYKGFFKAKGRTYRIEDSNLDELQSLEKRETEDYINNFIFIPCDKM